MGVYRTFGDLAGAMGPLVTTSMVGGFSFAAAFLLTAALEVVSHLLFGLFARETAGPRAARTSSP